MSLSRFSTAGPRVVHLHCLILHLGALMVVMVVVLGVVPLPPRARRSRIAADRERKADRVVVVVDEEGTGSRPDCCTLGTLLSKS